uniref:Prepronociceptin b n=1 Tax=Oryzias sinensis TaxID=183150 RepID=A0A8C8DS99_9TELE
MKIPLWCQVVLLACLFSPGHCDCQGECVACGLLLQQHQLQQAFNTIVCLLECEGHASSSLTWEVCKRALKHQETLQEGGAFLKRGGEQLKLTSEDLNSDSELLQPADRFQDRDPDEADLRSVQYDSSLQESSEEVQSLDPRLEGKEETQRDERDVKGQSEMDEDNDSLQVVSLSKRFGGFQRGRHGYRKLIGSPMRPLQKRYGGFIGVRKSARKWNSQKRVNQLLRQYLGMRSSRSGRFNASMNRAWRQNKL